MWEASAPPGRKCCLQCHEYLDDENKQSRQKIDHFARKHFLKVERSRKMWQQSLESNTGEGIKHERKKVIMLTIEKTRDSKGSTSVL